MVLSLHQGPKTLTIQMIEAWSKLLAAGESFKGLRDLVRAFESACHLDDMVTMPAVFRSTQPPRPPGISPQSRPLPHARLPPVRHSPAHLYFRRRPQPPAILMARKKAA